MKIELSENDLFEMIGRKQVELEMQKRYSLMLEKEIEKYQKMNAADNEQSGIKDLA